MKNNALNPRLRPVISGVLGVIIFGSPSQAATKRTLPKQSFLSM